ncbi:hypothetical protein XELAEV_180010902mg, partial [Xenopus laevis]
KKWRIRFCLAPSSRLPRVGESPAPSMHRSSSANLLFTSLSTLNRNLLAHFRVPALS